MAKPKPYRQAALCFMLNSKNEFLIGASPRDGGYKFPQGGLRENELPLNGLIREMREELGVDLTEADILEELPETFSYPYPEYKPYSKIYRGQELHVFIVKLTDRIKPVPQNDEFSEMFWVTADRLTNFDFMYRDVAYYKMVEAAMKIIKES